MEWILVAMLTVLAIVLHSPSEQKESNGSKERKDISTKC